MLVNELAEWETKNNDDIELLLRARHLTLSSRLSQSFLTKKAFEKTGLHWSSSAVELKILQQLQGEIPRFENSLVAQSWNKSPTFQTSRPEDWI